jgi:hypothetical protein
MAAQHQLELVSSSACPDEAQADSSAALEMGQAESTALAMSCCARRPFFMALVTKARCHAIHFYCNNWHGTSVK